MNSIACLSPRNPASQRISAKASACVWLVPGTTERAGREAPETTSKISAASRVASLSRLESPSQSASSLGFHRKLLSSCSESGLCPKPRRRDIKTTQRRIALPWYRPELAFESPCRFLGDAKTPATTRNLIPQYGHLFVTTGNGIVAFCKARSSSTRRCKSSKIFGCDISPFSSGISCHVAA